MHKSYIPLIPDMNHLQLIQSAPDRILIVCIPFEGKQKDFLVHWNMLL